MRFRRQPRPFAIQASRTVWPGDKPGDVRGAAQLGDRRVQGVERRLRLALGLGELVTVQQAGCVVPDQLLFYERLCLTLRGQLYTKSLIGRGDISVEEAEHALKDFSNQLEHVQRGPRAGAHPPAPSPSVEQEQSLPVDLDTSVPFEVIHRIGDLHGLWVPETVLTPLTGHFVAGQNRT
jgi:hypothetical protein